MSTQSHSSFPVPVRRFCWFLWFNVSVSRSVSRHDTLLTTPHHTHPLCARPASHPHVLTPIPPTPTPPFPLRRPAPGGAGPTAALPRQGGLADEKGGGHDVGGEVGKEEEELPRGQVQARVLEREPGLAVWCWVGGGLGGGDGGYEMVETGGWCVYVCLSTAGSGGTKNTSGHITDSTAHSRRARTQRRRRGRWRWT